MLVAALVCAIGGHWAVLQSVAWTRMMLDNVKHADVCEALEKTFDGQHPCALCKSIDAGRQSQKKQDMQADTGKINLFFESTAIVVAKPAGRMQWPLSDTFSQAASPQPPVPPPRNFPG